MTDPVIRGSLDWYAREFSGATLDLDPAKTQALTNAVGKIVQNKAAYQSVEVVTHVPWYMVGCLHYRESSFNFNTYLGNGDALSQKTRHVPAGRGPFITWLAGAVDVLEYDGLAGRSNWTIASVLALSEKYNGMGYMKYHPDVPSPYLWSYTSLYKQGKYASDGHFNYELVDQQVGVAALLKELQSQGLI